MSDSSLELPEPTGATPDAPGAPGPAGSAAPADPTAPDAALQAPAAIGPVAVTTAIDAVPIAAADQARLDALVASYIDAVSTLDPHSAAFAEKVTDIGRLGDEDIRSAAAVSNRLLQKPLAAMQRGGVSESSAVSASLLQLRRQVEDLDPSRHGSLIGPRKLLGILPFGAGSRIGAYFDRYRTSQHQLEAIIRALDHGQAELLRDNVSIAEEKANLWAVMGRLRQYAYLAQSLDGALVGRIAAIEAGDPERATALREDLLFPVRQKSQDLLTQLAVSVQGYLALDVIRRNNLELVRGVQRATTTTVSALRTAVIVAQALSDQKLVLDQITALNSTTSRLIESTSEMLHQQSSAINRQAASATVDLTRLQAAFTNIYATMDEIDAFKLEALATMDKTVTSLTTEVAKAQGYLDRVATRDSDGEPRASLGPGSTGPGST